MARSAGPAPGQYTCADLELFYEDNVVRAIIGGDLVVNPAPTTRHQDSSKAIFAHLYNLERRGGGKAYYAPYGVYLTADNFVEPDLIFIRSDHLDRIGPKHVDGPPDLVVEVSSPATRLVDRVRKRDLYERFGIPEYWIVDLENEQVEVYVLVDAHYPDPLVKRPGDTLEPSGLPGLSVPAAEALGIID